MYRCPVTPCLIAKGLLVIMEQLIFIGGMARSGINLLRTMLNCHPSIAAGPATNNMESIMNLFINMSETHRTGSLAKYLSEDEFTNLLQGFVEGMLLPYARKQGKPIVVEASANTIWAFQALAQLFPTAKFINVVRDGRDVIASHRNIAQKMSERGIADINNIGSPLHTAALWRETVNVGMSICGPQSDLAREGRAITVRYEDLVMSPVHELQRICRLLNVTFDQEMLHPESRSHDGEFDELWTTAANAKRPVSTDSIGKWLTELSFRERMLFLAAGQEALVALRYEETDDWSLRDLNISQEDALLELELVNEEIALSQASIDQSSASTESNEQDSSLRIEKVVVDNSRDASIPIPHLQAGGQSPPTAAGASRRHEIE